MSMVKCAECGKGVSNRATTCPHCGVSPVVAKQQYITGKALLWTLVVSACVGFILSIERVESPPASPVVSQTDAARGACMLFIKRQLHDPGSAEFQESTHTSRDGDTWTVHRAVRAKNALGAMRLQEYECQIRQTGDQLSLISLQPR